MDRLPCGTYFESYEKDMAVVQTKVRWVLAIFSLAFLFCLPLFATERILGIINIISINVIAVLGLNILTGCCGQISLGHAAFMGVGAYSSGIFIGELGLPFWASVICAALSTGIVGMVFGLPSLRIKGFYLILATVAAQFILVEFLPYQLKGITGGGYGLDIPAPKILGKTLNTEKSIYFFIASIAVLMAFFAKNILRTKAGRAFIAIRDNDLAASVMGINLYLYKLMAFFIGCFYAGLAGAIFAHYMRHVDPGFFTFNTSVWYLGMIIVGGIGSTAGAIMGTIFFSILIELTIEMAPVIQSSVPFLSRSGFASLNLVIPSFVIILFLIFEPRGLYHRWEIIKAYCQFWPYTHTKG